VTIADWRGFLWCSGSSGSSISLAARGPEPIYVALVGLGCARQRSVNHDPLTSCSGGPWDRGNPCPRPRKAGRAAGAWSWHERRVRHVVGGGSGSSLAAAAVAPRPGWRLLHRPDATTRRIFATPRRIFAPPCVVLRHAGAPSGGLGPAACRTRMRQRQPGRHPGRARAKRGDCDGQCLANPRFLASIERIFGPGYARSGPHARGPTMGRERSHPQPQYSRQ